jgi:hypothetical protein
MVFPVFLAGTMHQSNPIRLFSGDPGRWDSSDDLKPPYSVVGSVSAGFKHLDV